MPTILQFFKENYRKNPDKTAVVLQHSGKNDAAFSYHDLGTGSSRYAQAYADHQIQPGEVVILILQHGIDLVFSFWGAILYGAVPAIMPFLTEKLAPERYRADLKALISVTQPAAIVTTPEFAAEVQSALQPGDSVRVVILTDQIGSHPAADLGHLLDLNRDPEEIALLQHSSGTTGLQKGVALSHRAIINQLEAYSQSLERRESDVVVSWLPLYHDMGLIAGFLMPILNNNTLILMSPFDWVRAPYKLFQSINRYRGTLAWLPNFAYNFCVQKIRERDLDGVDLSCLRLLTNCSEPVKWESHQAFYERFKSYGLREDSLHCSYAMAENVFGVTQTPPGGRPKVDEIDREEYFTRKVASKPAAGRPSIKLLSSGRALANTHVRILDDEGNELPDRVIGEIAVQSDCLLTGYYHRPDATEKAMRDGWFLTGDFGYSLDGEIFVAGRKKDMIIVGGKNIYPQDLETLAYEVPGIHAGRAVAFGIDNEKAGTEDIVIVAEIDTDDEKERQAIAGALRLHIAQHSAVIVHYAHMVGKKWIIKTSSGKTARSANKEKFLREIDQVNSADTAVG